MGFRNSYDVIVAGAGPAGASAAIHLANNGVGVLLVEQKKFPREKLCGEFISPECQKHFQKLDVAREIMGSNPALITKTVFYSHQGHEVTVPSSWFGGAALGLSRSVMDNVLLRRAQACGVNVLENANVIEPLQSHAGVRGVRLRVEGGEREYCASITIDATGRARVLARKVKYLNGDVGIRTAPKLVAFKTHVENARVAQGACEIYVYPGGYGGLSTVEAGVSNLCFIIRSDIVKRCHSNPDVVLREIVMRNPRAAYTLAATKSSDWLSASWESFGRQSISPTHGLVAIGDSATFIDPFTGSGMLMAFESGELVSQSIVRHRNKLSAHDTFNAIAHDYVVGYRRRFDTRLRLCGLLRRAAFQPRLAGACIAICGASARLRNHIARATRFGSRKDLSFPQVR